MIPRFESFLLSWNAIVLVFAFVTLSAALGLAVDSQLARLSRWLEKSGHLREKHHEIAGHFIGVVGVIYAVLVAFVVVTAWQANDHDKDLAMQEQHTVDDLFHLDYAFHNSEGHGIRVMLAGYTKRHERGVERDEERRPTMLGHDRIVPVVFIETFAGSKPPSPLHSRRDL